MQYCITYAGPNGTCSDIAYTFDGKKYDCGSCASCTDAYYAAYTACQGAVGGCNALADCCAVIDAAYQPSCQSTLSSYQGQPYGDVSCHATLQSYEASKLCP